MKKTKNKSSQADVEYARFLNYIGCSTLDEAKTLFDSIVRLYVLEVSKKNNITEKVGRGGAIEFSGKIDRKSDHYRVCPCCKAEFMTNHMARKFCSNKCHDDYHSINRRNK